MAKTAAESNEHEAMAVLRIAKYLSQKPTIIPIGKARAEIKSILARAEKHTVVLTTHGEPQAAIVDIETLETMKSAVMQLLIMEMDTTLRSTQARVRAEREGTKTSFDELDTLVDEAVREGRKKRRATATRGRR